MAASTYYAPSRTADIELGEGCSSLQYTRQFEAQMSMASWVARAVGRPQEAPLRREDLVALARVLRRRRAVCGSPVFDEGVAPKSVCIIESGSVELLVGPSGSRNTVGLLRAGDVEGDIQILLSQVFPYSARAVNEVTCLILNAEDFMNLLRENQALAMRWITSISGRVARSQSRVITLLGQSVEQQISRLLLDQAEDGRVELPQVTMASMLGVTRSSLNRSLRRLEERKMIRRGYKEIEILDHEGVERRAVL